MMPTTFTAPKAPVTRHRPQGRAGQHPRRAGLRCPLVCALVAGTLLALPLHAGWRPVGPPVGTVNVVAVDPTRPSTILAGTDKGLFRSDDRGATWELAVGDWFSNVGAIAFDRLHPGRVYVGISGAVWHSLDHGRTWFFAVPNDEEVPVTALAVDATGRVYAGAGELFRSADRGRHWVSLGFASPAQSDAASLAIDPASSALYSAAPEGLYRSRDGGSTFRYIGPAGAEFRVVALAPSNPAVLYTGGEEGLFRSTDGGAHWQEIDAGLPSQPVTAVAVHPTHPRTVYVALQADNNGLNGGLFESTDGGAHWAALGTGLAAPDALSVALDPSAPARVYAGLRNDGVISSADAGSHWSRANTGIYASEVTAVVLDPERPGTIYAGLPIHGLYKSTDGGLSWQLINDRVADSYFTFALDPHHTATVYAAYPNNLERSDDGGQSWKRIDTGDAGAFNSGVFALDPHDPSTLYAGGDGTFSKSTDRGDTWSAPMPLSPLCPLLPTTLVVSAAPPYEIYASGYVFFGPTCEGAGADFVKSSDGGATWVQLSGPMRQVLPAASSSAVVYTVDLLFDVLKSTDGGFHFTRLNTETPSMLALDPTIPGRLYIGIIGPPQPLIFFPGTILTSDDDFVTFEQVGGDLDSAPETLAVDPNVPGRLWAGTVRGVFVFDP